MFSFIFLSGTTFPRYCFRSGYKPTIPLRCRIRSETAQKGMLFPLDIDTDEKTNIRVILKREKVLRLKTDGIRMYSVFTES